DGYVSPTGGSRATVQAQDQYGGTLMRPANAAYQQAQPDLAGLDPEADRMAQCYVGSYSRIASNAGTPGKFTTDIYGDPEPKADLGFFDGLVQTITGFFNTASYEQSCFSG